MKLAALTFLKNNMYYKIITSGQEWRFTIEADPNFKRKGVPQECLFIYRRDLTGEDIEKYQNKVCVIISNIDLKFWKERIDDFLWLTQKEMGKVPVVENGEVIGEILLGEKFCYKNYVKEIYVDKIGGNFGLNVNINLDRDRNCIPDLNQRNEEAHKLISNVLKNLKESNDTSDRDNSFSFVPNSHELIIVDPLNKQNNVAKSTFQFMNIKMGFLIAFMVAKEDCECGCHYGYMKNKLEKTDHCILKRIFNSIKRFKDANKNIY